MANASEIPPRGPPQVSAATVGIVSLIMSSIVFGLFHPITRLYIVLATLMGLYFGWLVLWTGNLLIPITAHAAYDAAQLLLTRREVRSREPNGE